MATGTPVTRYIHTDNLGSTNITSDANQNRAQWFDYAPYGSVIASTNTGTTTDARQYIGQFSDASGLSYLNARYYNGAQGQFTSEDPVFWGQQNLQDPQSFNAYSYSDENPIVKSDPSGKCIWDGCSVEFLAVLGIAYTAYDVAQTSVDAYDAYITDWKYRNQFSTNEKLGTVGHLALDVTGAGLGAATEHVGEAAIARSLDVTLSLHDALGALNTYFYGNDKRNKQKGRCAQSYISSQFGS